MIGGNGALLTAPLFGPIVARKLGGLTWYPGVGFGDGRFVALGSTDAIIGTTNCVICSGFSSVTTNAIEWRGGNYCFFFGPVAYGCGRFAAVAEPGGIVLSSDGINWTGQNFGATCVLHDVILADEQFVAVGDALVAFSPDGVAWTNRPLSTALSLRRVAFGRGQFVACDGLGRIFSSSDAVNWSGPESTFAGLSDVAYGGDYFVAVGSNGLIVTSIRGQDWFARSSPFCSAAGPVGLRRRPSACDQKVDRNWRRVRS